MNRPITVGQFELTASQPRIVQEVRSGFSFNASTYRPKEGFAFLQLTLSVRNLAESGNAALTSEDLTLTGRDGQVSKAIGRAGEADGCMGCVWFLAIRPTPVTVSPVWTVPAADVASQWLFQFKDGPTVAFTVPQ